jgi:nucleoside-diphosphate-sugar epimerase
VSRRALVTGATGGLGRTLVPALIAAGYDVTATGRDRNVGAALEADGARFVAADLLDPAANRLPVGTDVVFHLAALSSPWGRAQDFAAINIEATLRLLDHARAAGCDAFIHASTPSIYAEPRDRLDLTEASPQARRFANDYAATKYAAEQAVIASNGPGFATIAIRPRAIVGPHDAVLLPRLIRASRKGHMPLPNGGRALIELTDVRDAAAAFIAADAARALVGGEAFNISGGQPRRLRELLGTIFAALGTAPRLMDIPAGPAMAAAKAMEAIAALLPGRPEPPVTRYSIMALAFSQTFNLAAARDRLGWTPHVGPEAAIAFALDRERVDA